MQGNVTTVTSNATDIDKELDKEKNSSRHKYEICDMELKMVKDTSLISFVGERIEKEDIKKNYDTCTSRGQREKENKIRVVDPYNFYQLKKKLKKKRLCTICQIT